MTTYAYSLLFRDLMSSTFAADRDSISAVYGGHHSAALDALAAECRHYIDDAPPMHGRYHSAEFTAWLNSPDGELRTERGQTDLAKVSEVAEVNEASGDDSIYARALHALLAEWHLARALADMATAEADAEVSVIAEPFHFVSDPCAPPSDGVS